MKTPASSDEPVLRTLTDSDIPQALALKEAAGWNQIAEDWQTFLNLAPETCFALEQCGRLAATSTAMPFTGNFGWVGMVLVHPQERRKGFGTRMLVAAVEALERRGLTAALDATPEGKKVYDRHGFHEFGLLSRFTGKTPSDYLSHPACRPIAEGDLQRLGEFDSRCFGADRSPLLKELFRRAPRLGLIFDQGKGLEGFILGRHGSRFVHLGPWVAATQEIARALLETAFSRLPDHLAGLDVPDLQPSAAALVRRANFIEERRLIRMVKGSLLPSGQAEKIYAIAGPEFG